MKYTEIFKLKNMLEQAGIPFGYKDESEIFRCLNSKYEKHQICYPVFNVNARVCSVIQGHGTYGNENDLLEIMGLLTDEESEQDSVVGWLTAEDVFNRIKTHYEKGGQE